MTTDLLTSQIVGGETANQVYFLDWPYIQFLMDFCFLFYLIFLLFRPVVVKL